MISTCRKQKTFCSTCFGKLTETDISSDSLSGLERHSCQQCSKIIQTHSTSLTSRIIATQFSSRDVIMLRDAAVGVVAA